MADKIKGITVQIGGDTSQLSKALKSVQGEIKETQSGLKEVNKLLKLDPSNTTLLTEKQKLLEKQINSTTKELTALKQAQQEAKTMLANGEIGQAEYDQLSNKIAKAEKNLAGLRSESEKVEKQLPSTADKVAKAFDTAGDKLDSAAKALTPLSTAAAGVLAVGVKSAKDWETAFTGVKKTVKATDSEYKKLGESIKEMALRTASSAEEIAAVAEVAGQLGVSKDDLIEFTEVMVNLGDTTNLSATEAAKTLAQFVNITGSSTKDIKKLGSAVVALGNNFATDEASILAMSQRLAATGKQAGLTEPEILALATAMSSVGINAEAGGTAMTQTMTAIDKAVNGTTAKSKKNLESMAQVAGMSAEAFANAWKNDPMEALTAFIGGLGSLDEEGESTTAMLEELGMSGVRQSLTLKSLALASDTLTEAVSQANSAYKANNALTEEAELRYSTLDSQMSQTKEALKQVAMDIGEALLPIVKDLLDDVKDMVDWFKSLDDGTKKMIVTVTAIVAAAAPVLKLTSKISKGISSLISGVKSITTKLGGMTGPISLAVAGITALVSAIVSWRNKLKATREEHAKLTDEQQALADNVNAEAESWANLSKELKGSYSAIQTQTKAEKDLWTELTKVVDENGKVIEGHEEEAELLTGQLASALGIEIELVDGQIQGYKDLADNIDAVLAKKQAEAVLAASEESYTQALMGRKDAAAAVTEAEYQMLLQEEKVAAQTAELEELNRQLAIAQAEANDETGVGAARVQDLTNKIALAQEALDGDIESLETQKATLETAQTTLQGYDATLANHDKLQAAIATGSTADLQDAVSNLVNGFVTAETGTKSALERQTKTFMEEYAKQREIVEKTGSQEAKTASYAMGELVNKSIAELKKLDPALAAELQKELNTINKKSQDWNRSGANNAKQYTSGFSSNLNLSVEQRIKAALDLKEKAKKWGEDMMKNYAYGIETNANKVTTNTKAVADKVKRLLGFSEPEEGPLSDFHTYGPDMMRLLAQGIQESSWMVLQAAQGVASNLKSTLEGTTLTAKLDQSVPVGTGLTLNISNFNNYSDSDIRELTNEIMETAASFAARKGAVFA